MTPHSPRCVGCKSLSESLHFELGQELLDDMERMRRHRRIARRQVLFLDGEAPEAVHCVASGSFKLYKTGADGQEHILGLALPGTLLGVRALLSGEPYSVSASAREESSVCAFEAARFKQLLDHHNDAAKAVASMVGRQLRDAREGLLERSAAPAVSRLVHCLLQLEAVHRHMGGRIRVTGQELASMIGVAPETVSRLLCRFTANGLLQRRGRQIQIQDRPGLEKACVGATA